jgi:hypothetical protein
LGIGPVSAPITLNEPLFCTVTNGADTTPDAFRMPLLITLIAVGSVSVVVDVTTPEMLFCAEPVCGIETAVKAVPTSNALRYRANAALANLMFIPRSPAKRDPTMAGALSNMRWHSQSRTHRKLNSYPVDFTLPDDASNGLCASGRLVNNVAAKYQVRCDENVTGTVKAPAILLRFGNVGGAVALLGIAVEF